MIPKNALNKIRSIKIYYEEDELIMGFRFFDKDGALLWKHGDTLSRLKKETVVLEENEAIVGVIAPESCSSNF
jgi:hypothetical protein